MKRYDTIVWDVDGTLLNTAEGLIAAWQYSIETLGLPSRSKEELARFIGPVPQEIFQREFAMDAVQAQRATDIFRNWYKEHGLVMAHLYDGIPEVLHSLKEAGYKQAIATNKRQDYAKKICEIFGIDAYCSPILGPDNVTVKSKSGLILDCLSDLRSNRAIMIGDTEGDKKAADEVHVDFLGVNYGFGFHSISGYANTPREILKLLK